ncbi:hypothetical protein LWI28_028937 [Acer negundo]|uniref:Uncharacterized protein n=1 Tax=Acer negundo TaxID=4023 RepID=A0AAD5J358_ACENE|nr:hypothetical protein LWI28_028937 [Acer negundo]
MQTSIYLLLTSNPSIQYTVFDQLKRRLLKQARVHLQWPFLPSRLLCLVQFQRASPLLHVPQLVIQAADPNDDETKKARPRARKTLPGVAHAIFKREGILGFFKGPQAQILKNVLSVSFDDQGETYLNNLGSHTCNPKVSIADKG